MRISDIEMACKVITSSGIATATQREAICQRLRDWYVIERRKNPTEPDIVAGRTEMGG